MINETDIIELHSLSIQDFGGVSGMRDRDLMLSAINRPFQTFDGTDLYTTAFDKAAALGESLIINHPFVDGNKRTAFLAMLALLLEYGYELTADSDTTYSFVVAMAQGLNKFDEILAWFQANCKYRS